MPRITFRKTGDDEAIIRYDGEAVGDLYRHEDPLTGRPVYLVLLIDDARGWKKVFDRSKVHQAIRERLHSHRTLGWRF